MKLQPHHLEGGNPNVLALIPPQLKQTLFLLLPLLIFFGIGFGSLHGRSVPASAPVPNQVPGFSGTINGQNIVGLIVTNNSPTIEFTWNHASDPSGIQRYQIVVQRVGVPGWLYDPHILYPATSHSLPTSGLLDGASYSIHIRAKSNAGAWGPFINGGSFSVVLSDNIAPSTVPNFTAKINGQNVAGLTVSVDNPTINFSWNPATDNASGIQNYQVVLRQLNVGWILSPSVNHPATSYNMATSNLVDGASYMVHIRARDNFNNWGAFVHAGVFTVSLAGPDITPPSTVPNFMGKINGQNLSGMTVTQDNPTINFTWNPATDVGSGVKDYQVVLNHLGVGWEQSTMVNFPSTSHTMTTSNLVDGDSYRIHIRARDHANNWGPFVIGGTFSIDLTVPDNTAPSIVPNFVGRINGQNLSGMTVAVDNPTIAFTWNPATDVGSGVKDYQVVLNHLGVGWEQSTMVNFPATSHTMTTSNLIDGDNYRIHIRARDHANNWGPFVSGGTFTITLPPPGDPGSWSSPLTWAPNPVPQTGDDVVIPLGKTVTLDVNATVKSLTIYGTLKAKRTADVNLTAEKILVMGASGVFDWGTASDPYLRRSVITLVGDESDPGTAAMGTKFLGAMGGATIQMHGQSLKSWTRLNANAVKDDITITLSEPVNWRQGDSIIVVSSTRDRGQIERAEVLSVSQNGLVVTLKDKLNHAHIGKTLPYSGGGKSWTADLRAEVGLLTHNITVQGTITDTMGFGGHIMIMNNSKAYIDGVELYHMGQRGILGRYPFHWHMLGNVGNGQYFKNSSVHRSFNRAITIHGTESTLVEGNFFYDHIGHGVFLEDGSERFNTIRKNVTLLTRRPKQGQEVTPSDNQLKTVQNLTPASYWITNPLNYFIDNVAAGTEGTGYWFAFPQTPMGQSASDPRFMNLEPHKLPLGSFTGNSAHSSGNGFDIFDQLDPDHKILPNFGWEHNGQHLMENCTWYANGLALYTGIGVGGETDNLIFRNNIIIENTLGIMFASNSIVDQSLIVAKSGEGIIGGKVNAYRVYDGPGQVHNSHFIGWNDSQASLLTELGAATKHPNHIFTGNTKFPNVPIRIALPDFDIRPQPSGPNDPGHPRVWSHAIRDLDGSLTGEFNSTIVGNHPFQLVGDEIIPPSWVNARISSHKFALSRLVYGLEASLIPNVTVTRTKPNSQPESVYYIDGHKENHQLPFIVNEAYEYIHQYEALPASKLIRIDMLDASSGDDFLSIFKEFGRLNGIRVSSAQTGFRSYGSLANLNSANTSGYYVDTSGDLYVKARANAESQSYTIKWNTNNITLPKLDTDGDEMADNLEVSLGRHAFKANDLASEFSTGREGWVNPSGISGLAVTGGRLIGTSTNNDPLVVNSAYNFNSDEVTQIQIRMKATANGPVQLFFATALQPGFSAARVIGSSYSGNNGFQTLTFNVGSNSNWQGLITDLRLDPAVVSGVDFEIDWIRASGPAKREPAKGLIASSLSDSPISIFPNPFQNQFTVDLGQAGTFRRILLIDLKGRILREETISPDLEILQLSLEDLVLPDGIYLLQLSGIQGSKQMKVVKVTR